MGILHEGHVKRKIHKDPNNTKWTRDTTTFGQKILRAQGWQPGQFLGAQDAPHSELHTAANASYIRVVLKDDMKGLGFSRSKEDEVTGLDVFQDLLSRLNGKTEDVIEEEQQTRLAVKANYFVEQRYGPMRFVYGGLLVGDEMKGIEETESSDDTDANKADAETKEVSTKKDKESKKDKKSRKRKASDEDEDEDETSSRESESKKKKRRKEERKLKDGDNSDDTKTKKKEKKSKDKSRKKDQVSEDDEETLEEGSKKRKSKSKSKDKKRSSDDSDDEKARKKAKKEKKEKKRRKEEGESSTASTTPAVSGTSTPQSSRNFVRSRFIAQKRQAFMDPKALAQIFMVKA